MDDSSAEEKACRILVDQCSVGHSPLRIRRIESVAIHWCLKTMLDLHEVNDRKAHRLINEQPMKVIESSTVSSISERCSLLFPLIHTPNRKQKPAPGFTTGESIVHKPVSIDRSERCETLGHQLAKRNEHGESIPRLCSMNEKFGVRRCARASGYASQTLAEDASSESNGGSTRTIELRSNN